MRDYSYHDLVQCPPVSAEKRALRFNRFVALSRTVTLMFSKLLNLLLLVALTTGTAACAKAPADEIQVALQQRLRYNGYVPVISAKKATHPQYFPSGFEAPPEEVWCVVIDTSSIPNNPVSHYVVTKRGLQYSAGLLVGDEYLRDLFPRLGCDNF